MCDCFSGCLAIEVWRQCHRAPAARRDVSPHPKPKPCPSLFAGHLTSYAQPLLDDVSILSSQPGRPRKRCKWLLADKGYDAEALRRYCDQYRMQPVIPMRSMKRKPKPGLPRLFDRPKYRQRNIIERMFGWLKENRRIVTRFDKLAKSYAAMVSLACSMRCLRHLFSYRA